MATGTVGGSIVIVATFLAIRLPHGAILLYMANDLNVEMWFDLKAVAPR
jgi:hypothetical protein